MPSTEFFGGAALLILALLPLMGLADSLSKIRSGSLSHGRPSLASNPLYGGTVIAIWNIAFMLCLMIGFDLSVPGALTGTAIALIIVLAIPRSRRLILGWIHRIAQHPLGSSR